jgi:hypothetical protein
MSSRLRIGLLVDSFLLPAWAYTAINRVMCSDVAGLELVILNKASSLKSAPLSALWRDHKHWLYFIFNFIDEKLFLRGSIATTPIDASNLFLNLPVLEVIPVNENGELHVSILDTEQVKSYRLDILIKLGFDKLSGDILTAASYGIWTYRWGDSHKIKDGLLGFWEVVEAWPETGAALQKLGTTSDRTKTLCEAWFSNYPYSPARTRSHILWSVSSFLSRQIERLHRLGGEKFFQEIQQNQIEENETSLKSNEVPSNMSTLKIIVQMAVRNLLEVYRRIFYRERWELLFCFDASSRQDISSYRKISTPNDCFWADPHVVYKEPNYYIFVEELNYRLKKGHISVIEMDCEGNNKGSIPVLQKNYHLSFPSVFEWDNRYFMVPETAENRTIDLYECIHFPDEWKFKLTLMKDVTAVDTTLLYFHEKWWLFTGIAEQPAAAPQFELFLFYSDDLFTDHWQAHPLNPIVSDVKKARAAGRIYVREGKMFRPSQNCSKSYGYGFDINEIITLSETEYCERKVRSVRPGWAKGVLGTHTYAYQNNLTIIDMLTRRFKWV